MSILSTSEGLTKIESRLLQPHVIPKSKWEVISMDFIVGFSLTVRRHELIFMVVDTLMKSAHFIPMPMMY
jgi:hypothetical protein